MASVTCQGFTPLRTTAESPGKRNTNLSKWNILFDNSVSSWLAFRPNVGSIVYTCFACRDMFSSKNSFLDHVNRRSLLITYKCDDCFKRQQLIFYNPCSLLLHTRDHYTSTRGHIYLGDVTVNSLPVGMAGLLPYSNIPVIYDVEDSPVEPGMVVNSKFYSPCLEDKGGTLVRMYPNELLFYHDTEQKILTLKVIARNIPKCEFMVASSNLLLSSVVADASKKDTVVAASAKEPNTSQNINTNDYASCSECHSEVISMTEHFTQQNKPVNDTLRCSVCKFIASSQCSYSAHMRLHAVLKPFVCPECGKTFDENDALLEHMNVVCFHLAKQVRLKCPFKKCGKLFAQEFTFSNHFGTHLEQLTGCGVCKIGFFNRTDLEEHQQTHSNTKLQVLYKCKICPENSQVISEDEFQKHVNRHISDPANKIYAYMCRKCRTFFRSTVTYATHLLRCPKSNGNERSGLELQEGIANRLHYVLNVCLNCKAKVRYLSHSSEPRPMACPKCGTSYKRTFRDPIAKKTCMLCNEEYADNELENHKLKCKYANAKVLLTKMGENRKEKLESPKSDDSTKRKKKRNHPLELQKIKKIAQETAESELYAQLDIPSEFDGSFHCKLCEFTDAHRETFHSHVKTHREVSTCYQCMDCGECFVVKPSLVKHLQFFHKIFDTDRYFEENDCFDRAALKELEEIMKLAPGESKNPVEENQCRVCLQKFEDELELKKHFRVHGMAFLMHNTK